MAFELSEEQQAFLESEKDWRSQLSIGEKVEIIYWPTGGVSTGTVADLSRQEIDVETTGDKELTFDRKTGIGVSGSRREDNQIINRYAVRPAGTSEKE